MKAWSTMLLGGVVSIFLQASGGEFCPAGKSAGTALAPQILSFEGQTFPGVYRPIYAKLQVLGR